MISILIIADEYPHPIISNGGEWMRLVWYAIGGLFLLALIAGLLSGGRRGTGVPAASNFASF